MSGIFYIRGVHRLLCRKKNFDFDLFYVILYIRVGYLPLDSIMKMIS